LKSEVLNDLKIFSLDSRPALSIAATFFFLEKDNTDIISQILEECIDPTPPLTDGFGKFLSEEEKQQFVDDKRKQFEKDIPLIKLMVLNQLDENVALDKEYTTVDYGDDVFTAAAIIIAQLLKRPDNVVIQNVLQSMLTTQKGAFLGIKSYELLEKRFVLRRVTNMSLILELGNIP